MTLTPPSWAYPYATVWDDFDSGSGLIDSVPSSSGVTWVVVPGQVGSDDGGPLRGLAGGGLVGVAGLGTAATSPIAWAQIPVAGLINSAYVRSDVYRAGAADAGADVVLALEQDFEDGSFAQLELEIPGDNSPDLTFSDYVVSVSYLARLPGSSSPRLIEATITDAFGWHSYEMTWSATSGVQLFQDGVLIGSAGSVAEIANFVPNQAYILLADDGHLGPDRVYLNNFETGPLPVSPLVVPVLRAASGPSSLHFQPPRINT